MLNNIFNMFNDNNDKDENKSKAQQTFEAAVKSLWNKIPFMVKLYIIGGLAGTVLSVVLIASLQALIPFNFLFYSDDIQNNDTDIANAYEEYWGELCGKDSKGCNEEQKKAAERLKEDQTAFYDRLDSLTNSYLSKNTDSKKQQRYIILTTIFYGYEIEDLTTEAAFTLDDPDNDDMTIDEKNAVNEQNIYQQENDTLKELVKQFKTTIPMCYYGIDEEGNPLSSEIKNGDESFVFNFYDKIYFNMGLYKEEEYQKAEKEQCQDKYKELNPEVKVVDVNEGDASTEAFYKYLRTSEYLDNKEHLRSIYINYARNHNLDTDIPSWPESDKQAVRESIIQDIKNLVEEAMKEEKIGATVAFAGSNRAYWWPIGSKETELINGKEFANGNPQYTYITSDFGDRSDPFTGVVIGHGALDIQGDLNSTNVIASIDGTVSVVVTGCTSYGDTGCGGGYGNYISILDKNGNKEIYAHLHQGTVQVKEGDKVKQGQVLAKVGSSGRSTGPHLHFEMRGPDGQTKIDPLEYVDQIDTRPKKMMYDYYENPTPSKMYQLWLVAKEGCANGWTNDHKYYYVFDGRYGRGDGKRTLGHGLTIEATNWRFKGYGLDLSLFGDMSTVSVNVADQVKKDIVIDEIKLIVNESIEQGITLDQYQIEGLASFLFNLGEGVLPDFWPAYKKYQNTEALFNNFFLLYVHSNNDAMYMEGLINRRKSEWEIFYNGNYNIDFFKNPSNQTLEDFCVERSFVEAAWEEVE